MKPIYLYKVYTYVSFKTLYLKKDIRVPFYILLGTNKLCN